MQSAAPRRPATSHAPVDSPHFWRAVADSVPDMLLLVDPAGTLLYVNRPPEGTRREELLGRNALDFVPTESRDELQQSLHEIFGGAPPRLREQRGVHPDGTERWYTTHTGGVHLDEGVAAAIVVARDVTERRRLEQRACEWQKMDALGQFTAGIVHDFNNVLAIVRVAAQLIAQDTRPDSAARADAETILAEATRGAGLTRQLLAFTRRQPLAVQEVDLNGVIRDVAAILRQVLDDDVTITECLDPDGAPVCANRSQLEQVVMNLVLNARDAIGGTGTITLATVGGTTTARLRVTDTGSGMTPETRARIFEPFFTTKSRTGGTGLGLWTVHAIVSNAGGSIDVHSAPGAGTTFDVSLPASPVPATSTGAMRQRS